MKKFMLFTIALGIGLTGFSQNIPKVSKKLINKHVQTEYKKPMDMPVLPITPSTYAQHEAMLAVNETKLGETVYDLQTNACINNRFYVHEDGTMAAVWTRGLEATSFPDRGTGYNYYDGASWGDWPTERIEDRRCGWPSYAAWGANGEVVVVHNGVEGLEFSWRATKGSGNWIQQNFLGPAGIENDITWPRMITTGNNHEVVHLFVNSYVEYLGQPRALLYSRTDDGGATWDPHHVILNGLGVDYYTEINADDYVLAAKGNTVVLLVASSWNDMFYMRSDDNGDTWEKTIVWEHPYPFFDWNTTIADTFFCCDGSANVAIDNDGIVHVVFGISRVMHPETGTTYYLFPYVDGVVYWNEDMSSFSDDLSALAPPQLGYPTSEMIEDVNYIGWMQDVNGNGTIDLNIDIMYYQQHGPSNMPAIFIDDEGFIHVLFVSTTETYVSGDYNYKHLWYRTTRPLYWTDDDWSPFMDLTEDIAHIFDESYYPGIGGFNTITKTLHYIFNTDVTPGLAWSNDHGWQTNNAIYGAFAYPVGIGDMHDDNGIAVGIFPNPVENIANIKITLKHTSDIHIRITDLTGKKVKEINYGTVPPGVSNVNLDVAELSAGIYFYTVMTGSQTITGKIVVR